MSRSHSSLSRARLAAAAGITALAALSVLALLASVFVGVAYSADPPLSPPIGEPQGDVRCTGTVVNVSVDNVVVPAGATCFLNGTQVRGSVLAEQGSTLTLGAGTHVRGNVEAKEDAAFFVSGSKIGGNIKCDRCRSRFVSSSDVGGSLQAVGSQGSVFLFASDFGGDVEIVGTAASSGISIFQTVVVGNVKIEKNGGFAFVGSSTIGGNLQSIEGAEGQLIFNTVGGNMQVFKNQGAVPTQIFANTIAQALQCQDNQPPPVSFANSARSFEGQCGPPG